MTASPDRAGSGGRRREVRSPGADTDRHQRRATRISTGPRWTLSSDREAELTRVYRQSLATRPVRRASRNRRPWSARGGASKVSGCSDRLRQEAVRSRSHGPTSFKLGRRRADSRHSGKTQGSAPITLDRTGRHAAPGRGPDLRLAPHPHDAKEMPKPTAWTNGDQVEVAIERWADRDLTFGDVSGPGQRQLRRSKCTSTPTKRTLPSSAAAPRAVSSTPESKGRERP